jgi:hypothetical protein
MNKYEQLIEHIINDDTAKARALFHNIVVEKSRDIYESLIDETDFAEEIGGNKVERFAKEVKVDEQGISEEDEEAGEFELGGDDEEGDSDFDGGEEFGGEEFGGEEQGEAEIEDRVVDLETALDELKAEFDALMAGEEGEEEHADMFGGDDETSEFSDDGAGEFDETIVREYVEKVAAPSKTEGGEVARGGSVSVNKQSIVAKKNDMGGSSANIVRGGTENGGNVKKPTVNNLGNINVPGGKAGSAFKGKAAPKAGEGQTTDGKVPVATKSPLAR